MARNEGRDETNVAIRLTPLNVNGYLLYHSRRIDISLDKYFFMLEYKWLSLQINSVIFLDFFSFLLHCSSMYQKTPLPDPISIV